MTTPTTTLRPGDLVTVPFGDDPARAEAIVEDVGALGVTVRYAVSNGIRDQRGIYSLNNVEFVSRGAGQIKHAA